MRGFVDNCPDEISGLAKVDIVAGKFMVTDVRIFKQTVSPTHSDISGEALAAFQVELIKAGENPKDWFCWWHSHAKMKTFFSGTDTSTINSSTDFKVMLSIVTNHAHEFSARFDLYSPVRMYQDVTVEVLEDEDDETIAWCKAEIAAKVSKPVYKAPAPSQTGFKYPHTGVRRNPVIIDVPEKETRKKNTALVSASEREQYKAGLQEIVDSMTEARMSHDFGLYEELSTELYDKKVDGYYLGYETLYPVKRKY